MGNIIGVVYAEKTKVIRRMIITDIDSRMEATAALKAGESLLTFEKDFEKIQSPAAVQARAWELLGVKPEDVPSGRCAVIDEATQMVTDVIAADPDIDSMPSARLVASDEADVGWKHDGEKFLARYVDLEREGNSARQAKIIGESWLDPTTPVTPTRIRDVRAKVGETVAVEPITIVDSSGTTVL